MVDLNKGATVELVKALSDDIRTLPGGTKAASAGAAVRAIAYRTDAEATYPHRYFKILDELTPGFRSETGDRSNNAWDSTNTTKRHIVLPAFPNDTERVVMLRQNNDNLSVKTIKILADDSSQYIQYDNYVSLSNNPDYAVPTLITPASGQLAVVFSLEDAQMADGYFSSFPLSFVDSYVAKYGMSKNEILAQSYDTSSDNLFPRDRRLWHEVYDSVGRGELFCKLVPATTGITVGAIQSAFIPYNSVQKVSVSHHTADYSLTILGVDENYNPVCWTAGGPPLATQTETFTFKSGKTVHDIKYISYFLKSTTGAMLNADTLDFDTIDIRVRLYDNLTPHRIRIMEYNMGHYNFGVGVGLDSSTADRYITGMKNLFGNYRPDVLFATEYTDTLVSGDSRSANTMLFNPVFKFASNTDGSWNTIRSVYSLSNISSGYILPASTYLNSKPYRYAEINVNNHSVGLCCVHFLAVFPESGSEFQDIVEARAYEMEQALALFDNTDYGILAGDFNCLNSGEKEALNQMAVTNGFTPVNGGYFGWKATHSNTNPTTYLDNIYVKGDIKISSFSALTAEVSELPSDHIPIIADIIVY